MTSQKNNKENRKSSTLRNLAVKKVIDLGSVSAGFAKRNEMRRALQKFKNAGKEIKPIAITVAPTMPVLAASKAPTKITERPSPPLKPEKKSDILSRSSSATFDFSNNTPIKINKGTAIKVEFVITPKIRFGRVSKRYKSKTLILGN